ncbi:stemmadenine O-acetyltransferase-like [Tripterygium wilfordii]|uniref:stemmadenine O-acetyltransferase-like n=1 Tax=Tripterygium wilfordii TaxID=458696 RepID=UPI0018F7F2A1|nr:stemmadenine O-acetyltransferase-like [Tripterygium wilfordii]
MTMEIEIISKESIKPASPTPHHLKTHKISLVDQFGPSGYAPILLFYSANHHTFQANSISKRSLILKQSLSETLARYYPAAGKVRDSLSIDCDDEGALYIETRINCSLKYYLGQLDVLSLDKLAPDESFKLATPGTRVVIVKENVFACGGIALGFIMWHSICDAATLSSFLKTWSALARRSSDQAVFPNFIASSLFPPNESFPQDANSSSLASILFTVGNSAARRFLFDGSVMVNLKAKATSAGMQNPTRAEVVSALIFKSFMAAAMKVKHQVHRPTLMNFPVNLRRRMTPPLPENCLGNLLFFATVLSEGEEELDSLVRKIREARSKINGDLLKSFQGEGGLTKFLEIITELRESLSASGTEHIGLNSWCNFGFYDVDYGWGKPLWIPFMGSMFKNYIFLMDTRHGNGIEAWVSLDKEVMAVVEQDQELLSFASIDPTPLDLGKPISLVSNL